MPLTPGATLTHYEIIGLLGAGAMGEVYRARDSRLGREVAIKVLPEHFAVAGDRMERFEREAQTLASLNHPNVAQIFGVDQVDDTCFLVLELVPGETLAERLARGPLPVEEALGVCIQVAAGVEAAHESGVIHRDLKPGNVMLTADGKAKVLDFGLARPESPRASPGSGAVGPLTEEGVVLGTPSYMSPEQVRGKPIDRRSDIFAFGCVLYACLVGTPPFSGETSGDVMAAILDREPDLAVLPARTPPRVRELLARCLEKDAARRLRDIGDARLELERAVANREWSTARLAVVQRGRRSVPLPWILGGLIGAGAAVLVVAVVVPRFWQPEATAPTVTRFVVNPPGIEALAEFDTTATLAISPDGSHVVFVGRKSADSDPRLFLRDMSHVDAAPIADEAPGHDPFFSPDGAWLGFFWVGRLWKVPLAGGSRVELATLPGLHKGSSWGPDGIICSPAPSAGLFRISADGGALVPVTELEGPAKDVSQRWPDLLPDGRHILCTIKKAGLASFDDAEIAVYSPETRAWKTLIRGGYCARYAASGHLVYVRNGALMAVAFDAARLEVKGMPTEVVAGVMCEPSSGAAQFAISRNGTLVYAPGGSFENPSELVWIGRDGKETPVGCPIGPCNNVAVSPDGRRIAESIPGATDSIFVYDTDLGTQTRATFEGNAGLMGWTPDGKSLVYVSDRDEGGIFQSRADGSGAPTRLLPNLGLLSRGELAFGPKPALVYPRGAIGDRDLWMHPLDPGAAEVPLVQTPFDQWAAHVSPDGHWLAYLSNESGRAEAYVCPYPSGDGRWRISRDGASDLGWSNDGQTIFVLSGDSTGLTPGDKHQTMLSVSVSTVGGFSASPPQVAFEWTGDTMAHVTPDGARLLLLRMRNPPFHSTSIVAVLNWFEELRAKVPVR